MKNATYKIISVIICCCILCACDMDEILKDSNGEKVNLVRVDLPRFDARYTFVIADTSGVPMPQLIGELYFGGRDAINIVTDAGYVLMKERSAQYRDYRTTRHAMVVANLNPNFKIAAHPVDFSVNGFVSSSDGYVILPTRVIQTVAGDRKVVLTVIDVSEKQPDNYSTLLQVTNGASVAKLSNCNVATPGGITFTGVYRCLTSGLVEGLYKDGKLTYLWRLNDDLTQSPITSLQLTTGEYFITGTVNRANKRVKVPVKVSADKAGVYSMFDYSVLVDGKVVDRGGVGGILPFESTVECELPTDARAEFCLKENDMFDVVDDDDNELTFEKTDESQRQNFVARIRTRYVDDQKCMVNVVGVCSTNRQVALYPSIRFQYCYKDTERWLWCETDRGEGSLLLAPDSWYSIRIPINNTWYKFDITTDATQCESMLRDQPSVKKFSIDQKSNRPVNMSIEYGNDEFCSLGLE